MTFTPDPKPKTYRDPKYLAWIRKQPCHVCKYGRSRPHHEPLTGRGTGIKGSDREVIPLCTRCHTNRHAVGRKTFWYAWDVEEIITGYQELYEKAVMVKQNEGVKW